MSPRGGKTLRAAAMAAIVLAAPALAFVTFERLADPSQKPPALVEFRDAATGAVSRAVDAVRGGQRLSPAHEAPTERPAKAPVPRPVRVPILVYHNVRPPSPTRRLSASDLQYEVTPAQFDAEMDILAAEGYSAIGLDDLVAALRGERDVPEKSVVITLDDARDSQYANAYPSLKKHGFTATFFVFSNAVGRPGYLTWAQLAEMRDAGMAIEDHTRYHPFLTKIADDAELKAEIAGSKKTLEDRLGIDVRYIAYPFGAYDDRVLAAVKDAGYVAARGLGHVAVQDPGRMYDLGGFIATGDPVYFKRAILGSEK